MNSQTKEVSGSGQRIALMAVAGIGLGMLAKAVYKKLKRYELSGKVVLITGGSRGLGLEMARVLASKGARIAICARTEDQLKKAESELQVIGAQVLAIIVDLRDQNQAVEMIKTVESHFGGIDVVINNAGVMVVGPENVMEVSDYRQVMESNLWSALYTVKAVVPYFKMQGHGRIVNICSIGGKIAVPHMLPYSVSKFAMVGLSQGLSAELRKDNIHVTTVIPNLMRTGSPRNVSVKGDHEGEYAWFKIADSLPFVSQDSRQAAEQIIAALENGDRQLTLTWTAQLISAINGVTPGAITLLAEVANRFLPESDNKTTKKGFESESDATMGKIGALTDAAAENNNQF